MKKKFVTTCGTVLVCGTMAFAAISSTRVVDFADAAANEFSHIVAHYRGSCNTPSHHCSGYAPISASNHDCKNCASNGYKCHAVNHQPR